jgi:hypothetical protein
MGREGFEPPKRFRNGFTARPIWPLWNLPIIWSILNALDRRFKASEGIRTPDPLITNQPLYLLSYAGVPSTNLPVLTTADTGKMRKRGEKIEKPSLLEL